MTAGWVLPRDWDASRLLRFLTGLAMLALAFAANAGLIATRADATPAPATVVSTTVDVPAAVDGSTAEVAPAPASAVAPMAIGAVIEIGVPVREPALIVDPAGAVPGSHGSRGPPAV
jgi:hypothetical protein